MPVHGHLTVNGTKMSKSRGTFITGQTYLESGLDPELLRYFYAANLGPEVSDLDLSLEEFRNRVNADLANNIANLASRVSTLLARAGGPVTAEADPEIVRATREAIAGARRGYLALEYREVVRLLSGAASVCNRRVQETKPWEKPDGAAERAVLYATGKALGGLAVALAPIMPRFAAGLAAAFGVPSLPAWPEGLDPFDGKPLALDGKPPQIARVDAKQAARLVEPAADAPAPPPKVSKAASPAETASKATQKAAPPPPPGVIGYDEFAKVELKVAVVKAAEKVQGADKLLKLSVDVGEPEPRTIVAGIALAYPEPQQLVGRRIVVVANLAPRPLRGITSHGMLLAAGEAPNLQLVTVGEGIAPGTRVK
jgi:methionyl-tRNA synthetase